MNWNHDHEAPDRRTVTDGGTPDRKTVFESGDGSHHPGPPRFVTVGDGIVNPNGQEMETRDDLAPWNPDGDGTYEWYLVDSPEGATAEPTDEPIAEFEPDVPGVYTLALEAPDGTHQLTVRAFPEADDDAPRPRIELDAVIEDDRVVLSPTATCVGDEPSVEYYVDDRDADVLESDRTIPIDAVDEPVRIYAVAVAERHSVPDMVELVPDEETGSVRVEHPFEPPAWVANSIVYEIFTRRFPDQNEPTFATIADRLDHLERLGVDVLWLTPFLEAESGFGTPMARGGPHGYNTRDYFTVDADLGTMVDFEALVDACHDRGIKVVFDLVINHTADTHPFYEAAVDDSHPEHERYRDWYRWEDFEARDPDTYFGWDGIPNLDYGNPEVREYLLSVVDFWADWVDGIRADVAWGVPLTFWTEVHDRVTSTDGEFFLLDETLPSDVEMGGGRFHMHHDDVLHDTLERLGERFGSAELTAGATTGETDVAEAVPEDDETTDTSDDEEDAVADEFVDRAAHLDTSTAGAVLDAIEDRDRRGPHPDSEWLLYVENHDTDRYLSEYGQEAQRAAAAATFTLPGSPMCYYGQETGVRGRREPMNWGAFDESQLAYYERLFEIRREESALQTDASLERIGYESETDAAVAFARFAPEEDRRVVVAIHFGEGSATVAIEESVEGTDLLTGEAVVDSETGDIVVDSVVVLESESTDD